MSAQLDPDIEARVKRLTPGQRSCLQLVAQQFSSKEIALRLGISSHTVDQRVRQALRTLEVSRRADAARIFCIVESETGERFPLPFARRSTDKNKMTVPQRMLWITFIALGSAFITGAYFAVLGTLFAFFQG
nr:helix-turn-helix transcriptional regulator [Sphingomonas sp.]